MTSPTGDYLWLILLQQLAPAKMKISILAVLQSFRNPHPFTGRFPLLSSPSPLQMHLQMNKRWETGRLAGVLVTMAASKWNAKAPETDSESRNQVYGIELPVLIALLHAQSCSLPSPPGGLLRKEEEGSTTMAWALGEGRTGRRFSERREKGCKKIIFISHESTKHQCTVLAKMCSLTGLKETFFKICTGRLRNWAWQESDLHTLRNNRPTACPPTRPLRRCLIQVVRGRLLRDPAGRSRV